VQIAALGAFLLAATARREEGSALEVAVARAFRVTSSVLIASVVVSAATPLQVYGDRPAAIVALLGLGWFLAEYRTGNARALWWCLAIVGAIGLSLSRAALFAAFVLLAYTLLASSRRHRVRNLILFALLLGAGYVATTQWAPLRERFTQGDTSLSVAGLRINAEGRTGAWSALWKEVPERPFTGFGAGAASERTAELTNDVLDHPHNDYLRLLYDFGVIGVALWAWFLVRAARSLSRKWSLTRDRAALAALHAGSAVLIVLVTDNALDYAFVMLPLSVMLGLGLGAVARTRPRAIRT
jgi:O-antigen ligase